MKRYFLKSILIFLFLTLFAQCGKPSKPASYYKYQMDRLEFNDKIPHLLSFKRINGEINGTYYLTYSPIFFTETEDVRKIRHRFLEQNIALEMQVNKRGLYPLFIQSEQKNAKYVMSYNYDTSPGIDRTFTHSFSVSIFETGAIGLQNNIVWEGSVSIKKSYSDDISLYFKDFIVTLFNGFPEPRNSMKDFLNSLE